MKILIVDDESLVRFGIKSILPWEKYGHVFVGEASNGAEAIDAIHKLKPDIVITDLVMPKMDGLELIRQTKKENYCGRFIVMSCVTEIPYLQKAMSLGVTQYLLKSTVTPDEILECVNHIAEEFACESVFDETFGEEFNKLNTTIFCNEFLNLVFKRQITDDLLIRQKLSGWGIELTSCTELVVAKIEEKAGKNNSRQNYTIVGIGQSIISEVASGYIFIDFEDYLVALINCRKNNLSKALEVISFRIRETMKQYLGCEIIFSKWKSVNDRLSFADAYEEAKHDLEAAFFSIETDSVQSTNLKLINKSSSVEFLSEQDGLISIEKLTETLETMRKLFLETPGTFEAEAKKMYFSLLRHMITQFGLDEEQLLKNIGINGDMKQIIFAMKTFDEMHCLTKTLLTRGLEMARGKGIIQTDDPIIYKVVNFLKENISRRVLLSELSLAVHFSPDYLCKYFKKKTGINLTDYILQYKISYSEKLLRETRNVSHCSDLLGFSSPGHFVKTFKRYKNITPGEYIKQNCL